MTLHSLSPHGSWRCRTKAHVLNHDTLPVADISPLWRPPTNHCTLSIATEAKVETKVNKHAPTSPPTIHQQDDRQGLFTVPANTYAVAAAPQTKPTKPSTNTTGTYGPARGARVPVVSIVIIARNNARQPELSFASLELVGTAAGVASGSALVSPVFSPASAMMIRTEGGLTTYCRAADCRSDRSRAACIN